MQESIIQELEINIAHRIDAHREFLREFRDEMFKYWLEFVPYIPGKNFDNFSRWFGFKFWEIPEADLRIMGI